MLYNYPMLQMELVLVDQNEELLTCAEVAARLGVTIASISRWVRAGYFPNAWRINPHGKSEWRIPKKDVDAFIELRRTQRGFFYTPTNPPETKAE